MSLQPSMPSTPHQERILLLILAGIQFAHILDFMVLMPLAPLLMKNLSISTQQFALLVSIYTLAAAFSGIFAATFVDLFERKRVLLVFFSLFGLSTFWCALAGSFETLLLARALAGAFGGVLAAMVQTMVADLIPFERRGKASGSVMSATAVASVVGVPLALLLSNLFGWRVPFAAIGLLTLGFFVLAVLRLPTLRTHLSAAEQSAWRQPFAKMTAVLKERNHRIAILFMALGGGSTFIVIPYVALYLSSTAGLDESQIPLVYAIGGIASFFSARRIGRLADEWGKVRSYRIVALLSIIPIFILTHLPVVALGWVLLVTTVFFGLGPGRAVSAMAITISAVKPPLRGTFMSLNAAIQQLACGVAAYLGSLLISQQDNGVMVGFGHAGWAAIAITGLTIYLSGQIQMHQIPTLAVSTQAASPDAELLVVKANQ